MRQSIDKNDQRIVLKIRHLFLFMFLLVMVSSMMSCKEKDHVTITFETGEGSLVKEMTTIPGSPFEKPLEPSMEGHTFMGWSSAPDREELISTGTPVEEDVTLYAVWHANMHTITFVTYGGAAVPVMDVTYGTDITDLPVTEKAGMVFMGWHMDPSYITPLTITTMPDDDLILHARFGYEVRFVNFDGPEIPSIVVPSGMTIPVPDTSWTGHTLQGYYTSLDGGLTFDEKWSFTIHVVRSALVLYGDWTVNLYGIHFDSMGGSQVPPVFDAYGTILEIPDDPAKYGYTFMG
jgi:hypothetical protein